MNELLKNQPQSTQEKTMIATLEDTYELRNSCATAPLALALVVFDMTNMQREILDWLERHAPEDVEVKVSIYKDRSLYVSVNPTEYHQLASMVISRRGKITGTIYMPPFQDDLDFVAKDARSHLAMHTLGLYSL